jgi:hypothetical protein
MSLTKVTNSMINGAFLNVLDFGAVGDGVANDTAAIVAALAAGNNIYFPAGTYRITASIDIQPNKLILGAGQRNSIIKVDGAIYGFGRVYGSQTTSRTEIRNLGFEGTASALGGVYFENATRIRIDSCDFYDFAASNAYGIRLGRVYHWWVSNCGFENIKSVGLNCTAVSGVGSNHGVFGPNNDVIGNNQLGFIGVALEITQNIFIVGNNFEGSNNAATAIDLNGTEGIFIVQNYIELWLGAAIAGNGGGANRRVTVEQNAIQASTLLICNFNNTVNPNDNIIFRSNRFLDANISQTCVFFGTTVNPLFQDNDPNLATPTDVFGGNPRTPQVLYGSTTWDPANIPDNDSEATTLTVTGAEVGDVCAATFSTIGGRNMLLTAHVQSANTIRAVLFNNEGAAVDLSSGTVNVIVFKQ